MEGQGASRFRSCEGPLPGLQTATFLLCPDVPERDRQTDRQTASAACLGEQESSLSGFLH